MSVEVKSNQRAYQKSIKQLFDGIDRLQEVFSVLGMTTIWKHIGVFYAHNSGQLPLFNCSSCSMFAIIGEEDIPGKLKSIDQLVVQSREGLNASDHVHEFVEIAKQLLFIAQGDPYAPVTGSNIVAKTFEYVLRASNIERIFLWTPEQLSLIQAMNLPYVAIDAFYSTGKTEVLKYYGKGKIKIGENLHF